MPPKTPPENETHDMSRNRLENLIDMGHELVKLQYPKHIRGLLDEAVVSGWVETPYWQHFCRETYFRHDPPTNPSRMTRFRKRIGESV